MAASPVLADSSFYIRLLREGQDPLRALALAAATRDLAVCGIVRCEVGRALRPIERLHRFQTFWNVMINVPTDNRLWESVEQTAWELDRKGTVLPLTDLVIAVCHAHRRRRADVRPSFFANSRSARGFPSGCLIPARGSYVCGCWGCGSRFRPEIDTWTVPASMELQPYEA